VFGERRAEERGGVLRTVNRGQCHRVVGRRSQVGRTGAYLVAGLALSSAMVARRSPVAIHSRHQLSASPSAMRSAVASISPTSPAP
jgi:hypothetical protein